MSHPKAHASFTVTSYACFYIQYFFCLVALNNPSGLNTTHFRRADYPSPRTENYHDGSCVRVWLDDSGAARSRGYSQQQKEEIMTRRITQPTGSDAILSSVPGNGPGMTKKIIILWNAPKNIIKSKQLKFCYFKRKIKELPGKALVSLSVCRKTPHWRRGPGVPGVRRPGMRGKGEQAYFQLQERNHT